MEKKILNFVLREYLYSQIPGLFMLWLYAGFDYFFNKADFFLSMRQNRDLYWLGIIIYLVFWSLPKSYDMGKKTLPEWAKKIIK
jgi:hypothetical protein